MKHQLTYTDVNLIKSYICTRMTSQIYGPLMVGKADE